MNDFAIVVEKREDGFFAARVREFAGAYCVAEQQHWAIAGAIHMATIIYSELGSERVTH